MSNANEKLRRYWEMYLSAKLKFYAMQLDDFEYISILEKICETVWDTLNIQQQDSIR